MRGAELLPAPASHRGVADAWARRAVFELLDRIGRGQLVVEEAGETHRFGASRPCEPCARVRVSSPHAYSLALRGSIGLARGYIDGLWDADDLAPVIQVLAANLRGVDRLRRPLDMAATPLLRALSLARRQTRARSRRNVSAHYDLGAELFTAMLDETMAYSCAVFPAADTSLADASRTKFDMVCTKLGLEPHHHLLEIGGGWGGLAIHAASRYGCRVTAITISRDQFEVARERVAAAGLSGRVEVRLEDYRDVRGTYDRIASIEMIEAVGRADLDTYFATASRLLGADGAFLVQAIVAPHASFELWSAGGGFASSVIFPGGALPSVEAMTQSVARATDMHLAHLEDITPHYVRTLRAWRDNVCARAEQLRAVGYGERFLRLWTFYLAYCEGAFAARRIGDVQLLLAKPRHLPATGGWHSPG